MQVIEYKRKIHPRWKPLYKGDYRFILFEGGRGGRKSWEIADSLIRNSISKKIRILCTREIQNSIKESVHQLLTMRINSLGHKDLFIINREDITCKNGSKFIFKGLNDINDKSTQSLKSLEDIDICWIEEAQTITKNSLNILIPTIRKSGSKIIASFNRLEEDDPIYELVKNPRPKTYHCYVTYLDNPDISEEFLQEAEYCKKNHPDEYEHIYMGMPRRRSKCAVVKYFSQENITELEYQPEFDLHLTCDFNIGSMAWAMFHKIDDVQYFVDEMAMENEDTKDCALHFINRYPNHKGKIILNGDASGRSRTSNSKKSNYVILDEILTIQGERKVYFDTKCKHCIECCKTIKYDEKGNIIEPSLTQIQNGADKWARHFLDTISYPSVYYFPLGY